MENKCSTKVNDCSLSIQHVNMRCKISKILLPVSDLHTDLLTTDVEIFRSVLRQAHEPISPQIETRSQCCFSTLYKGGSTLLRTRLLSCCPRESSPHQIWFFY